MALSVKEGLSDWYDPDQRDLPWKNTRDPYNIWLSEIILQQTRVEQGRPYYRRFIEKYPDVQTLAAAPLDDVLKLWEGLGYYSRARNLHAAARQVVEEMNGEFPADYQSLLQLRGVGEYTAAAIASFAYDEAVAVVDGNVFRFISRLFGIDLPIDSTEGKRLFRERAREILNKKDPAMHNQAIMDFGALVCLPRNPLCIECPFRPDCVAVAEDRVDLLPVKARTAAKRDRYFTFFIIRDAERVFIEQRSGRDVWKGLYQFPVIEHAKGEVPEDAAAVFREQFKTVAGALKIAATGEWYRQVLSHQRIHARFVGVECADLGKMRQPGSWKAVRISHLEDYAYPRIIHNYLQESGGLSG